MSRRRSPPQLRDTPLFGYVVKAEPAAVQHPAARQRSPLVSNHTQSAHPTPTHPV